MAGVQYGPLPSSLVLLSELQKCTLGEKVRFLGCVTAYSTKSATLTLQHNYPPGHKVIALVEVELLLSTLKSNETQVGEWVNVIGYIKQAQEADDHHVSLVNVIVQALVLWSSGPIKLEDYETVLEQRRSVTPL
ncbi:CST complex subunit Ten1 [Bisporella sp. PMI_857]|nr:CST complex subunit Ten1 [Bisporella sp. PMI_857]